MYRWLFTSIYFDKADDGAGGEEEEKKEQQEEEREEPTLTQKQLNDILAKQKNKEVSKFAKELGFSTTDDLKAAIEAKKKLDAESATEAEKIAAKEKEATDKITAAELKAERAEAKAYAMEQGISPKIAAKIVKLAETYDDTDSLSDRIDQVLEDFKDTLKLGEDAGGEEDPPKKKFGAPTKKQGLSDQAKAENELRKSMGLKAKA